MKLNDILNQFHILKCVDAEIIKEFQADGVLRVALIEYSKRTKNRAFAIELVNTFIVTRRQAIGVVTVEDLMFACFNLALQNQIEDCLKIWEAKNIDFDTYCGLDVQLMPFAGVTETIEFLKLQKNADAEKALLYIVKCNNCGDFNHQHEYFSPDILPWFL